LSDSSLVVAEACADIRKSLRAGCEMRAGSGVLDGDGSTLEP